MLQGAGSRAQLWVMCVRVWEPVSSPTGTTLQAGRGEEMTLVSIVDSGAFPCNESAPCSFLHLSEGGEKAWMCEHAALLPAVSLGD